MVDFNKTEPSPPQSFKGHAATATVLSDRVVIERGRMGRLGGNRDSTILFSEVMKLDTKTPTRMINGHVHFVTESEPDFVKALGKHEQQVAANPNTIMFTWGQRDRYEQFLAAVTHAMGR